MQFKDGKPLPADDATKITQAITQAFNDFHEHGKSYAMWPISNDAEVKLKTPISTDSKQSRYLLSGSAEFGLRHLEKDELHPNQSFSFEITFEDCTDEYGLPDLKVTAATFG